MKRPDEHETWLLVANTIAARGTCHRRRVGCVLVDRAGCISSTGYNGPGPGQPHCTDHPCAGAGFASGTGLGECEAIHAEQNALITCKEFSQVRSIYSTAAPCIHCTKMLLRTTADEIYFIEPYANSGQHLWERTGRKWIQYTSSTIGMIRYFGRGQHRIDGSVNVIQANLMAESLIRTG